MHAARTRDRDPVELLRRQVGRPHLLAGPGGSRLDETKPGRRPHRPRETLGHVAGNPVQDLRALDEPEEALLIRRRPFEVQDAAVVGREARRGQQVGLESDVEPLVDRSKAVHELRFDRRRDHDGHQVHAGVLSSSEIRCRG